MPWGRLKNLRLWPFFLMGMDRYLSEPVQAEKQTDINELDNLLQGLLECSRHCESRVWEEGATPSRSRRCKWGRNPRMPLSSVCETYFVKRIS